ncbi:MAG: RHS repeat-associated core domain-containing protein, partial [Clostridiales bacterium]|nr:RHS repeat-associated core domain-containing protein [Clostridiales bacterium]
VSGPDRSATYTYNDLGRLAAATVTANGTTVTESYIYDWAGSRTAKITDGVLTYYLVDTAGVLSQVLAELDHTGALITHYTRGSELISLSRPGEKHYYLHDGHGSVRALSDTDGQVTDTYHYDAFGNLISKTGTTENDFLYTGEQYDKSTGFYYLRARYMNPSTGTFTLPDAYAGTIFDPVSLHKYLYANANPVMNRDPSGYQTLTITEESANLAVIGILAAAFVLPVCIINLVSRQGVGYTPINVSSINDDMVINDLWRDISIGLNFVIRDSVLADLNDQVINWTGLMKGKLNIIKSDRLGIKEPYYRESYYCIVSNT